MGRFWETVRTPRVMAAYRLSIVASGISACINAVCGLLVAWVLVRYDFFGKSLMDSLVDLPFALPTAVGGVALTTAWAPTGVLGRLVRPLGVQAVYTRLGVVIALTFIGLPFVVRTVQPVLQDLDAEVEGSGDDPWSRALASVSARHFADRDARRMDRLCLGIGQGPGRVWNGRLHFGQYAPAEPRSCLC